MPAGSSPCDSAKTRTISAPEHGPESDREHHRKLLAPIALGVRCGHHVAVVMRVMVVIVRRRAS